MEEYSWNPWHGCHKLSPGCAHCYVYRTDARYGKDSSEVKKTGNFALPVAKKRDGSYKIPSGSLVDTCFTSDFFVEEADEWRVDAWKFILARPDLNFFFITKRIDRFLISLPMTWGDGLDNVAIGCTVENNDRAAYRLPIFRAAPIKHKLLICAPLLEGLDLSPYLDGGWLESVSVGGESGNEARPCDYAWVLDIREQCVRAGVPFNYHQTGARLIKDGRLYSIKRGFQHSQAWRAGINYRP